MPRLTTPLREHNRMSYANQRNVVQKENINIVSTKKFSADKEEVFQLQLELSTLRQRLKLLDGGASKNELLDLLQEKDEELSGKNKQISILNNKFHKIAKAVSQMEKERIMLQKKAVSLETENKTIQRHLAIREKEVSALVTRCAAQEEKIMGYKVSCAQVETLDKETEMLKFQVIEKDKELSKMESFQTNLQEVENEKNGISKDLQQLELQSRESSENFRSEIASLEENLSQMKATSNDARLNMLQYQGKQDVKEKVYQQKMEALENDLEKSTNREDELRHCLQTLSMKNCTLVEERKEERKIQKKEVQEITFDRMQERLKGQEMMGQAIERLEKEMKEQSAKFKSDNDLKDASTSDYLNDLTLTKEENHKLRRNLDRMINEKDELSSHQKEEKDHFTKEVKNLIENIKEKEEEVKKLRNLVSQANVQNSNYKNDIDCLSIKITSLGEKSLQLANLDKRFTDFKKENSEKTTLLLSDLSESKLKNENDKVDLSRKIKILQTEKKEDCDKLLEQLKEKKRTNDDLNIDLLSSKDDILKMKKDMENLKEFSSCDQNTQKKQIKALTNELKKSTEINSLKSGQLNDAKQKNISLEADVSSFKAKAEAVEIQAAEIADDLTIKLEKKVDQYADLQLQSDTEMTELSKKLEKVINSKDKKLQQFALKYDIIIKERDNEENKNLTLKSELSLLVDAFDKSKNVYKEKIDILVAHFDQEQTNSGKDAVAFQEDYENLQRITFETEEKLELEMEEMEKVKSLLDDRTKLIGDMVSQNKEMDKDLNESRILVTKLQEELDTSILQKNNAEASLSRTKKEITTFSDNHNYKLQEEHSIRCALEDELEGTKSTLQGAQMSLKNIPMLEKENEELKDKVKRQQSYLERKLQQEKVRKNRMIPKTPSKRIGSLKTPVEKLSFNSIVTDPHSMMNKYHKLQPPRSDITDEEKVSHDDEVDELDELMDNEV